MNIETVYNELRKITRGGEVDFLSLNKLMEKIETEVRKVTCYKTTSKTRINAIKRVASKDDCRPVLQGYGIYESYKVVTDSYHLIAIKQDDMPIPAVSSNFKDLEEVKQYREEHGNNSVINGTYPNLNWVLDGKYKEGTEIQFNVDDFLAFYKLHKNGYDKNSKNYDDLYKIECNDKVGYFDPKFMKNVLDVIGKDSKVYFTGEISPLYFVNEKEELGVVLPIRVF